MLLKRDFEKDFEESIRFIAEKFPSSEKLIKSTLVHSIRIGFYLYSGGYNNDICIGGLLHDVLEDADVRREDISKKFGESIAVIVEANTKNKSISDREERRKDLINKCIKGGEASLIVKAADILDNIKYYKSINNEDELNNAVENATLLLKLLPDTIKSDIFQELSREKSL